MNIWYQRRAVIGVSGLRLKPFKFGRTGCNSAEYGLEDAAVKSGVQVGCFGQEPTNQ